MKLLINVPCKKCSKRRMIDSSKNNIQKYANKYPICHKCKIPEIRERISKGWFKKGDTPYNKGKPSLLKKDNPGYEALHEWVERWFGKPKKCEYCKTEFAKIYDWANRSNQYLRNRDDWIRLCRKCHMRYDYENFGLRKEFYT